MPAYLVFIREATKDVEALEEYRTQARAALADHPMTILARGPHEVWEGMPADGVLIMEFPTLEAARTWYQSPAYQAAKTLRLQGADYRVLVIESEGPSRP